MPDSMQDQLDHYDKLIDVLSRIEAHLNRGVIGDRNGDVRQSNR
jgi:hypothetical protein